MALGDKYVMNGVWLTCDKGVTPSRFNVTPKPVELYDEHFANELDKAPLINILPFGACSVTQSPCVPAPIAWERVMEDGLMVLGARPLLDTSKCMCSVGGKIAIHFTRADADAAVELDQQLDQVDEVADAAETASTWAFWGGIALAVGGAVLCATGVGAPLGAAMIVGGEALVDASAILATGAAVVKGATKFARDPSLENGLSIVGEVVENLVINYIMNKLGGAVIKRLGTWAQKAMSKLGLSEKACALADRILCTVTGHPVDVINGYLYTEAVDFEFPGPIPLRWQRLWNSTSIYAGPLGHGWHHSYDLALVVEEAEGYAALRAADGRGIAFGLPALGERDFNRLEKMSLVRDERGYGVLDHGQGLTYRFGLADAEGVRQLAAVENANGFAIRFSYDERGYLTQFVDSAKRAFAVQCDEVGRVLTISTAHPTEPKQRVTLATYEYSRQGELVRVSDALGQAAAYRYQEHLLVQETFKNGLHFYFEYEGTGPEARCVHTWGDEGIYDHHLVYDVDARRTVVTNSLGYATTYQGNENGLVVQVQDARGGVTLTDYNEFNDILSQTDALGNTTTYEYDERGNCLLTQWSNGSQQQQAYDAHDHLVLLTDLRGQQWQWHYDDAGNLVQQVQPGDLSTTYLYEKGLPASLTTSANQRTTLHYDAAYNLQEIRRNASHVTRTLHDGWGRPTKLVDARHNVQWRTYDLLGRTTTVHEPDGDVRHFTYDVVGNVTQVANRLHTVQYAYRGLNRLVRRSIAGVATEFLYDTEEQVRGFINEHGLLYHYELDALGQAITETGFDGLKRRYVRNLGGQIVELQLPNQQHTRYTYDAMGRVAAIQYSDGSQDAYTYGPDGALLTASNETTSVRFERTPAESLLREIQGLHEVVSSYDTYGRRQGFTSSLGAQVGYIRNAAGAVTHMQTDTWQAAFERDEQGLELRRQLSGGVQLEWQRDALGRPITQRLSTGSRQQVRQRRYTWQVAERLSEIQDNLTGTTRFEHDARGNLTRTLFNEQQVQVRQPDAVGNLFQTNARTDRQYGAAGQLVRAGGTHHAYDALGNLVRKTTAQGEEWNYAWNGAGQLASVVRPDGQRVEFSYDALGRRTSKRYQGQITRWVWDGHVPLHEWQEPDEAVGSPEDAALITWLFEADSFVPAARLTKQGASSIACDHLGTPLALYDGQGKQTWEMELDSYGAVRQGKGQAQDCPFRYQGQYADEETGLYYNRFRYYDPEAGQYISQDPIGLLGGSTLLSYVADPLVQVDVLGLSEGSGALGSRMVNAGHVPSQAGVTFVKSDFRAHHLIPHEVWTSNQSFFDDIGLNHVPRQINPKDAVSNGVFLPGTEAVGRQYGFDAYHAGGHPQTNDAMRVRVEDVRDRFRAPNNPISAQQARQEITAIQQAERNRLSARNGGGCAMMP